jgi:hypothetical protein
MATKQTDSLSRRPKVTREQLVKAAKLRDEGATWNTIREATGTNLDSSQWFRHWEQEKITHRAAHVPVPSGKPAPKPKAEPKAATKRALRTKVSRPPAG